MEVNPDPYHFVQEVVIFDGECSFCGFFSVWALDRLQRPNVAFTASGSAFGQKLLQSLDIREDPDALLLAGHMSLYSGSDAAIRIGRCLKAPWSGLALLARAIPKFFREPLYRGVARNRHRIIRQTALCRVPERFPFLLLDEIDPASEALFRRIYCVGT